MDQETFTDCHDADRPQRVYDYIVKYKSRHDGCAPSVREICIGCRITSTSLVNYYLDKLVDDGRIAYIGDGVGSRSSRGIMVAGGKWNAPVAAAGGMR